MMAPSKLGVYASLALAANAILVPPNVAVDNLGDDNAMETLAINPFKRTVALECPGCAYATVDGNSLHWEKGAGNSFLLDFEVGPNEDTLDLDGTTLYPPKFDPFQRPFYVTQVDPKRESEKSPRLAITGYSFHFDPAETVTEAGTELLQMALHIASIEGVSFDLPALNVNLLKDVEGRMMIASFQTVKVEESSPIEQDKECKEWPLLCKWKSILGDKIGNMKNSMGKGCHRHNGNPMQQEDTQGKPPHLFRPGQDHPHHHGEGHAHGHHHHHHGHHRVHMFMRRAFFTIFIPIFIGILAGTLTYVIGMALGCLIAVVVAKVRGRGPYERVAQVDVHEDEDDVERATAKEEYAELPEYDAPPVYEEAAEKENVPERH